MLELCSPPFRRGEVPPAPSPAPAVFPEQSGSPPVAGEQAEPRSRAGCTPAGEIPRGFSVDAQKSLRSGDFGNSPPSEAARFAVGRELPAAC